ncbi:hypothetical protein MLD38_018196 [Melastoma candidum]|uniref:Uncharacterized protein n=1 Tax=Melastoma candidum TaxID=119954 RepID=A0ACB9QSI1_9MYRT|nr:hypothetical protein MLD38_018196 [Melastoma candidum]
MQMSCNEGCVSEAFYDPAEWLSIEELDASDVGCSSSSKFDVWLSEPQSVEQRRKDFLLGMGLAELGSSVSCSSDNCPGIDGDSLQVTGIDRLTKSDEVVSSASLSSFNSSDGCSVCSRNEVENDGNSVIIDREVDGQLMPESTIRRKDRFMDCSMKWERQNNELSLWKFLLGKMHKDRCIDKSRFPSHDSSKIPDMSRIKVHHNKKRLLELSALFSLQDIQAHDGNICSMKFSPNGHYLATGGEDGNIYIWRVTSADASFEEMCNGPKFYPNSKEEHLFCKGKIIDQSSVQKPKKIFWIDELPVQVLCGHTGDVLDLAWSSSDKLLSSSKDYTVRLWQVGFDLCQGVFHHSNYVTCIQFNPIDDDYFISGSIDGKARVWRVSTQRVVDWVDVRDAISAIGYRPHGKGFAVGTITGDCHFYKLTGTQMQRDTTISVQSGRKKHISNKITCIQFLKDISGRVLISSQDSKVRVFGGNGIIYQYKGPRRSGSQRSASFTSKGKHMVSLGDDSRVYLWNQSDYTARRDNGSSKSAHTCEYFHSQGASIMLPWQHGSPKVANAINAASHSHKKENGRFSLGKRLSQEGQCRTWPEELLPQLSREDKPGVEYERHGPDSETWGLVFVTGNRDGKIRTFHNYGLPVRL